MKLTILGGRGAWPGADEACSGYLIEIDGYRLLVDPGYATFPRLQRHVGVSQVDAVLVSHGHPDHCADLNPLLRARGLGEQPRSPLPVYAPGGALTAVLRLDAMRATDAAVEPVVVADGDRVTLGPFEVEFAQLPHHVPNLGMRISAAGATVAYTGDSGPDRAVVDLGRDSDLFLMEATYPYPITDEDAGYLCDVATAVRQAMEASTSTVVLTHLWPSVDPGAVERQVERFEHPDVLVARADMTLDLTCSNATEGEGSGAARTDTSSDVREGSSPDGGVAPAHRADLQP